MGSTRQPPSPKSVNEFSALFSFPFTHTEAKKNQIYISRYNIFLSMTC
jgi:hypothetical protein